MATQRTRWSLVVTIWLLHGLINTDSFQLTSILPNVIYACVNDNVTFNWTYTTSSGDVIVDTEWYATDHSEELVAMKAGTHFIASPPFFHRVQFVANAGFTLSDVIIGDSGNYSVRISGTDASGATFTASSYVLLDVSTRGCSDGLADIMTSLLLLEARQTQLQTENQQLKNQLADTNKHLQIQLQNTKTQLTESLQALTNKVSHQIGFYGYLTSSGVHSGRLPFTNRVTNYGNAFTPSTGTMRATIPGLYFLSMTSTPELSNVYPDAYMYKNGQNICQAMSAVGTYGQSISCSTVQHLSVGDEVHVESDRDLAARGTTFTGFLIVAD